MQYDSGRAQNSTSGIGFDFTAGGCSSVERCWPLRSSWAPAVPVRQRRRYPTRRTCRPASAPAVAVTTADQAAALVLASQPEFKGIGRRDPDMIGQAAWYEATPTPDGFEVVVRVGWGDCPAGCIDEHLWTFAVTRDGRLELTGDEGPEVPPEVIDQLGGG